MSICFMFFLFLYSYCICLNYNGLEDLLWYWCYPWRWLLRQNSWCCNTNISSKKVLCWLCCFIVILWFRDRHIVSLWDSIIEEWSLSRLPSHIIQFMFCAFLQSSLVVCAGCEGECSHFRSLGMLYTFTAGWTVCRHTMQVLGEYNPVPIRREVPEDSHDQ